MQLKKVFFMGQKLWVDLKSLNRKIPIQNAEEVHTPQLDWYYIKFQEDPKKLNRLIAGFDEQGIPLNSTYIDVEDPQLHYYPISIGQYALALFHGWLNTESEDKKAHFLRIADWFYQNRIEDDRLGAYWLTEVPKPEYAVTGPWKSAFTQSRGLSVLLRAWQLTGESEYLRIASLALRPFTYDISDGGVSVKRAEGETFYEEYVAAAATRVLDGHMFALFGLQDYVRAVTETQDAENHQLARRLLQEGIDGLQKALPDYDLGFWLRFNRCELPDYPVDDPCTIGYLKLVVAQLELVHHISGRDFFRGSAQKFQRYLRPGNIVKMYRYKFSSLRKLNRL